MRFFQKMFAFIHDRYLLKYFFKEEGIYQKNRKGNYLLVYYKNVKEKIIYSYITRKDEDHLNNIIFILRN